MKSCWKTNGILAEKILCTRWLPECCKSRFLETYVGSRWQGSSSTLLIVLLRMVILFISPEAYVNRKGIQIGRTAFLLLYFLDGLILLLALTHIVTQNVRNLKSIDLKNLTLVLRTLDQVSLVSNHDLCTSLKYISRSWAFPARDMTQRCQASTPSSSSAELHDICLRQ